jgi:hypothetical protein
MGCDVSSVFLRCKIWCDHTCEGESKNVAPFFMGVHCFAHQTNLDVWVFIKVEFGGLLGSLPLGFLWSFFSFT